MKLTRNGIDLIADGITIMPQGDIWLHGMLATIGLVVGADGGEKLFSRTNWSHPCITGKGARDEIDIWWREP